MTKDEKLRIVVIKDGEMFVAQCLDYDICTQAADIDTLRDRMDCLIQVELESSQAIDTAPERFHMMWDTTTSMSGDHCYRLAA